MMDHEDEDCSSKYFLNTLENLDKQEFSYLLIEVLDEPVETVLKLINKLRMKINEIVTDKVPAVRKFFMENIPNVLVKLKQIDNQSLNEYLYDYLIETIFREFFNEEVIFRQTARKIVLHLLDRGLLGELLVEETVVKILNNHKDEDLPLFMFYLAPVLGAEKTRKYFWDLFLDTVENAPASWVRKQCVRLIAMFGSILGQEVTERDLLPIYGKLCKSIEWGIRKECAVELPKISVLCTKKSREEILTPIVEELLSDLNKWVYSAAIEKLGIFIATFAEPEILTLAINSEGNLYIVNVADDNENYRDMLSDDKLKNFQYYEDMFAETLIPTSSTELVSGLISPFSSLHLSNSLPVSKTIICDDVQGDESDKTNAEGNETDDNPYLKFVSPNFLLNLSSSYSSSQSPSLSNATNSSSTPNYLQSYSMFQGSDFLFSNMFDRNGKESKDDGLCPDSDKIGMNELDALLGSALEQSDESKEHDTLNNNNCIDNDNKLNKEELLRQQETTAEKVENDNNNQLLNVHNNDNIVNNNTVNANTYSNPNNLLLNSNPTSSSNEKVSPVEEKESIPEEEKCMEDRTSAHLKRTTPEGLPMVIKMAIKSKEKKGKGLQLSALPSVQPQTVGDCDNTTDPEPNEEQRPEAPETPSIESAPTSCPFGEMKSEESACCSEQLHAEGQGSISAKKPAEEDCDTEFFSNNYWYIKPLELTVDELDLLDKNLKVENVQSDDIQQREEERESKKNESCVSNDDYDDDLRDSDQPEPFARRKLFKLISLKLNDLKSTREQRFDSFFTNPEASQQQQQPHIHSVKKSEISPQLLSQSVVPPILLHFFMEMSHFPEWDQICAYSFPAVCLTLGKKNWPLMRNQLQSLCGAIRWEVRQIIVTAIYQIALIIGRDYASRDLVPIFVSFFKDLDNVKVEALYNVTKFLQVIDKQRHIEVVAHLSECLEPENVTNWRFRKDLAQEILKLVDLFKSDIEEEAAAAVMPKEDEKENAEEQQSKVQNDNNHSLINEECLKYLTGYALRLLMDRVHSVREVAMQAIVSRMRFCNQDQLADLTNILIKAFANSKHWRRRQIFAQLCEQAIVQNSIGIMELDTKLMPTLIELSADRVPNVRLVVAKCLETVFSLHSDTMAMSEQQDDIQRAFDQLKTDTDRDVRHAADPASLINEKLYNQSGSTLDETMEKTESHEDEDEELLAHELNEQIDPASIQ